MTGIPLPFCLTLNQSTADDDTERKTNISFYPFNVCIFSLLFAQFSKLCSVELKYIFILQKLDHSVKIGV